MDVNMGRHLTQGVDSLEKTLMLGGIGVRRRRGRQRMRWLDGIPNSMDVNLSELWEFVMDRTQAVELAPRLAASLLAPPLPGPAGFC